MLLPPSAVTSLSAAASCPCLWNDTWTPALLSFTVCSRHVDMYVKELMQDSDLYRSPVAGDGTFAMFSIEVNRAVQ